MAAYTSGGDKLHMCYTFDFLSPVFTAAHFHDRIAAFEAVVGDGWPCWAFSNHDIMRHASRWAQASRLGQDRLARLAIGILLSLRGSVCLYQGEELGLGEADLRFEDLADPYGIRFWPEYKGRDGCRTPIAWEAEAPNGGFSSAKPWLPLSPEHVANAVEREAADPDSMLAHYRRMIAFRRDHAPLRSGSIRLLDAPPDILAFVRESRGEAVACAFNFSHQPARFVPPAPMQISALTGHGFAGRLDDRSISLAAGDAFFGTAT
jgi:alpha-glucosidase